MTFFSLVSFVQQVFRNIVNSEDRLVFPRRFPTIAKDLIKKLLCPNPALRCGMLRNGMSDVVDHAWFNGELVLCVLLLLICTNCILNLFSSNFSPSLNHIARRTVHTAHTHTHTGMIWSKLEAKEYRAPHTPAIAGDKDVSNFEEYPEDDSSQSFSFKGKDPFAEF